MRKSFWLGLLLGSALCAGSTVGARSVAAQTAGQNVENAGHPRTDVAQQAGNGIKRGTTTAYHKTSDGTKKVYRKTARGTKKVYHKTGDGVARVGDKVGGKPSPR
jgi:hypothetical protein